MSLQDDILDVRRLRLYGDFNDQVSYLLENVRLTRSEVDELTILFNDLQQSLEVVWPGCQIHPFGSIITGLGIKTSDVDCYVSLPSWDRTPSGQIVMKAKQVLSRQYAIFSELFAIPMAKVPIVKLFHMPTGRYCDVSFKSPSGVRNSRLLGYILHMDDRALPLAILIKYWSKIHKLTGTNLLANYALTLLVIFYLQQINILPSVYTLQRSRQRHMIDNWNTEFSEVDYKTNNNNSLFKLLGGFFEYYRDFDYNGHVISPYMGRPISKTLLKVVQDTPDEFELYKQNLKNQLCQPLRVETSICLQDPFDHSRNCTVAVHRKLATNLLLHFQQNAALMCDEKMRNSCLLQILTKAPVGVKKEQRRNNPGRVTKVRDIAKMWKGNLRNIRRAMGQGQYGHVKYRR